MAPATVVVVGSEWSIPAANFRDREAVASLSEIRRRYAPRGQALTGLDGLSLESRWSLQPADF